MAARVFASVEEVLGEAGNATEQCGCGSIRTVFCFLNVRRNGKLRNERPQK